MRILTTDFFFSIIRIATPILFATLAAVIGEKGGISNIGLEGIMMMSALFGSLSAFWSKSWLIGLLVAMAVGLLEALLMGVFAFKLKTDIILVGTAVNMIGSGGTIFLVKTITNITMGSSLTSTTSLITKNLQIPSIHIPLIKDIPVLGKIISGHSLLTYLAFLLVWLTIVLLYKTPLGLNIRSVPWASACQRSVSSPSGSEGFWPGWAVPICPCTTRWAGLWIWWPAVALSLWQRSPWAEGSRWVPCWRLWSLASPRHLESRSPRPAWIPTWWRRFPIW